MVVSGLTHASAQVRPLEGSPQVAARARSLGRLPTGSPESKPTDTVALSERAQALADVEGDERTRRRTVDERQRSRDDDESRLDRLARGDADADEVSRSVDNDGDEIVRRRSERRTNGEASEDEDHDDHDEERDPFAARDDDDDEAPRFEPFARQRDDEPDPFGLREREEQAARGPFVRDPFGRDDDDDRRDVFARRREDPGRAFDRADDTKDAFGRDVVRDPFGREARRDADVDPFGRQRPDDEVINPFARSNDDTRFDPFAKRNDAAEAVELVDPFGRARTAAEPPVVEGERAGVRENKTRAKADVPGLSFDGGDRVSLRARGRATTAYGLGGESNVDYRLTDRAATPYEVDRETPGPFGASGAVARRIQQFLRPETAAGSLVDGDA